MRRATRIWIVYALSVVALAGVLARLTTERRTAESRATAIAEDLRRQALMRAAFWRIDGFVSTYLGRAASLSFPITVTGLDGGAGLDPATPQILPPAKGTSPEDLAGDGLPLPFVRRRFLATHTPVAQPLVPLRAVTLPDPLDLLQPLGRDAFWRAFHGAEPLVSAAAMRQFESENRLFDNADLNNFVPSPEQGKNFDFNERRGQAQRAAMNPSRVVLDTSLVVEATDLRALWLDVATDRPELFLMRRLKTRHGEALEILWIDWSALRAHLQSLVVDLAHVTLAPDREFGVAERSDQSAVLPARAQFTFTDPPRPRATFISTLETVEWATVVVAVAIVGFVLHRSIVFGDRRQRFVSAVTHELRTPLTTFRLYSQMLTDGIVSGEAERREYLVTLRDESERLSRVVESVLLYSRIENAGANLRLRTTAIPEILSFLVPKLAARAAELGLDLSVEDLSGGACVIVDPQALEQIALNILENAAKYARAVDPRVSLRVVCDENAVEFLFRDYGPGIPPADRTRLFQPFERGRDVDHATSSGVGLGLAIARELARGIHGTLDFVAPADSGASFVLRLARAEGAAS